MQKDNRSLLGLSSTKMVIDNVVKLITLEDKGANCALDRLCCTLFLTLHVMQFVHLFFYLDWFIPSLK